MARLSQKNWSRLGPRLLVWVLLVSSAITLGSITLQISMDYRRDMGNMRNALDVIEKMELPSLTVAAWNFDRNQLIAHMGGMLESPWLSGVQLRYGMNENAVITVGDLGDSSSEIREYPLIHLNGATQVQVGRLLVRPNVDEVYHRTQERLTLVLAAQIASALVMSACLLLLVSALITRHLHRMAAFARAFVPGATFIPLTLERGPSAPDDELTLLQDSLNSAYSRLNEAHAREHQQIEELERCVAERTEELRAINARLIESEQAMRVLAHSDPLTGLANRILLDERLDRALSRAVRHHRDVVVLLIDLNDFKPINDRYGHAAGDDLLQTQANRMRHILRETDTLARIGGDEFVAVLEDLEAMTDISRVFDAMAVALSTPWVWEGKTITVSGSIGMARFPTDSDSAERLLRCADESMYAAKRQRRRA